MPADLVVLRVVDATSATLADLLQASTWCLDFEGLALEALTEAVKAFIVPDEVLVTRMTKSGARELDVRRAVLTSEVLAVSSENSHADISSEGAVVGGPSGSPGAGPVRDVVRWNLTLEHTNPGSASRGVMTGLTPLTGLQVPRSPRTIRVL